MKRTRCAIYARQSVARTNESDFTSCEAQREAVALAELIGGVIDSHTSL